MEVFRSTFLIRKEGFASAAEAVLSAIPVTSGVYGGDPDGYTPPADFAVIIYALNKAGLFVTFDKDGNLTVFGCGEWIGNDEIALMEQVFKAISKSVEPGTYIEFMDGESLIRYAFFWDTVERWTVPYVLYTKKEAI